MEERKPKSNESIEEWCSEIFGKQKFGVVFNSLEAYDNEISERMCSIVKPLIEKAGMPLGGLSFLFFMGNYGFTPFGIHKEAKGEEGFLFHMGPAKKKFYTWEIEEYNKIEHNTEVFHGVEEMLPSAESYELKPGSVMFIPNHLYHIANTEEFSLSIVMDYINPSREYLEQDIAKQIASEKGIKTGLLDYMQPISIDQDVDNMNGLLNTTSWERKFKNALKKHILKLKSNGGVLQPSLSELNRYLPNGEFQLTGKSMFTLIEYVDENENTFVMTRGNKIPVEPHTNLSIVLSKINHQENMSFSDLKSHFEPQWEMYHLFDFVNQLWLYGAIEVTHLK